MIQKSINIENHTNKQVSSFVISLVISVIYVIFYLCFAKHSLFYSSDTFLMLDIAGDVFSENNLNFARQFQFNNIWQNASFPILLPLFYRLLDLLGMNLEIVPILINLFAAFFINFIILLFSSKFTKSLLPGFYTVLAIYALPFVVEELLRGHTTITISAIYLALLYFIIFDAQPPSLVRQTIIGLLIVLATNCRFDALPCLLGLFVFICIYNGGILLTLRRYYLSILLALLGALPWLFYSLSYFDTYWVSDNKRTVLLALESFVTDWIPNWQAAYPTLSSDPYLWFKKYVSLLQVDTLDFLWIVLPVASLGVFCLLLIFYRKSKVRNSIPEPNIAKDKYLDIDINLLLWFTVSGFILSAIQLLLVFLSGYWYTRYMICSYTLCFMILTMIFYHGSIVKVDIMQLIGINQLCSNMYEQQRAKIFRLILLTIYICFAAFLLINNLKMLDKKSNKLILAQQLEQEILSIPELTDKESKILYIFRSAYYGVYISHRNNIRGLAKPRNLSQENIDDFLEKVNPSHVVCGCNSEQHRNILEYLNSQNKLDLLSYIENINVKIFSVK